MYTYVCEVENRIVMNKQKAEKEINKVVIKILYFEKEPKIDSTTDWL